MQTGNLQAMVKRRLWLTGLMAGLIAGCMVPPTVAVSGAGEPPEPVTLTLKQGATATLKDANIAMTVTEVKDLTSAGCLGGFQGCPDRVRILVSSPESKQEVQLYVAHTEAQRRQGVNQATVFGYRITLLSVKQDEATLGWEKWNRERQ